jgi:hypothetical protein
MRDFISAFINVVFGIFHCLIHLILLIKNKEHLEYGRVKD